MILTNFDYKVDRNIDTVLIDTENWIQNSSNLLQTYRISGRSVITYLSKIEDSYISNKFKRANSVLKKGNIVLVSRVASEIARDRAFSIGNGKYYNVPVMQILGYFEDNQISYDSLTLLYNKILFEKIDTTNSPIQRVNNNSMIGKVLKVGTNKFNPIWQEEPLTVQVGDTVIVKDNVTTKISLGAKDYYVTEESAVVGIFNSEDNYLLDNVKFINQSVLLKEYIAEKVLDSDLLCTPLINLSDLDYSDLYNINCFQVVYRDENLRQINPGDVVLMDRSMTNYVYINDDKYFIVNGMSYIEGKVL